MISKKNLFEDPICFSWHWVHSVEPLVCAYVVSRKKGKSHDFKDKLVGVEERFVCSLYMFMFDVP
mgnify:CR=1 FL=1